MKNGSIKSLIAAFCGVAILGTPGIASATLVTIDQIIYQNAANPGQMNGTLDITSSGTQLTILMRNTSLDAAFTDSTTPSWMLLTGFGLQLPGVDITGGTVYVNGGSVALNFDGGQNTSNIGNQWAFANAQVDGYTQTPPHAGVLTVDALVSSVQNGGVTRFSGPPPATIDGPNYGAVSAAETQFGTSTAGVEDTIRFVLDLNGTAPSVETIDAGNVVLAFGSPETVWGPPGDSPVPDGGSTIALLGFVMLGAGYLRRKLA